MKSDIEIAREVKLQPIHKIAANIGITEDQIEQYGKYKAKITFDFDEQKIAQSNLILVMSISCKI